MCGVAMYDVALDSYYEQRWLLWGGEANRMLVLDMKSGIFHVGTPQDWWERNIVSIPIRHIERRLLTHTDTYEILRDWLDEHINGDYTVRSLPPTFNMLDVSFESEADAMYFALRWK